MKLLPLVFWILWSDKHKIWILWSKWSAVFLDARKSFLALLPFPVSSKQKKKLLLFLSNVFLRKNSLSNDKYYLGEIKFSFVSMDTIPDDVTTTSAQCTLGVVDNSAIFQSFKHWGLRFADTFFGKDGKHWSNYGCFSRRLLFQWHSSLLLGLCS